MAGWSRKKREAVEAAFYTYLGRAYINSKDAGRMCLGENLYDGQIRFITAVFDSLENDIHRIFVLKSRQLGLSTIARALSIFLLGVHPGLKGAIVFDTDNNKNESRAELEVMINDLPKALKFPQITGNNRTGLSLANDSKILFMSAGVRKSKTSGTLGRSVGLSLAHLSELCSYDNDEGLEAFEQSLSEVNPDRLYIYESTARGFNRWWEMWNEARKDPAHCCCLFLGWWAKESQQIARSDPDFARYGETPPTAKELIKIKLVKEKYNHDITPEELSWIRRKMDPSSMAEGDADPEYEGNPTRVQEQAWTEDEAFQQTGAVFFSAEKLTEITNQHASNKYQTFMFTTGVEFVDMRVFKAPNSKSVELKVWEEPDPEGSYVLGVDPAFGENEHNDRSSIQVLRCFADGLDQVAEYAWPLANTRQFAWVVASLLGWYGQGRAECRYILELNGPGTAVFNELRSLKQQIESVSYTEQQLQDQGLKNIFRNVKTYIYSRPDSIGAGSNYHFKCLSVDEPIPTPDGWTTMGELEPGDKLFDENGKICRVQKCSPVMRGHECYKVIFEDDSEIVADADHLWPVNDGKLVKTVDLLENDYSIACPKPLKLAKKDLPIDPYVLGVWIGDGYSAAGRYCSAESDIDEISKHIKNCGRKVGLIGKGRTVCYQGIVGLTSDLRKAGLINNKHIPEQYLRGSFEQRLALLQGLMDTDGTVSKTRQCSFTTTLETVANSFDELLRSLGIRPKHSVYESNLIYRGKKVKTKDYYQFWFTGYEDLPVFRLRRKLLRLKNPVYAGGKGGAGGIRFVRSRRNKIIDVQEIESVPVRCIQVDSPSHLYLAGCGMIPTHNTTGQLKITILERLRDFTSNGMLHLRSLAAIDEMKTIARDGDSIGAPGSMKDDRVLALALATHYWETGPRKQMIAQRRTRESEAAKKRLTITDQVYLFQQNQLQMFFDQKRAASRAATQLAQRAAWRGR